jgi:DNA polymerase (family X)
MRYHAARVHRVVPSAVDNLAIARVLAEIGDLLEIKGENPFKIRAYRNAAETVTHAPAAVSAMSEADLRALPGIGKDLAAKIAELLETGSIAYHQDLLQEFPPSILDMLHLQGVGPKTVAMLYRELNVRTLDDLQTAASDGRLRLLKGMGSKKEAQILKAVEERARVVGRRLVAEAYDTATALVAVLREHAPEAWIGLVGSLRRGCETCGDLDILAAGAPSSVMQAFTGYRLVERILLHGDTKSSVLLWGGFQADLRLVPRESLGAALQYFTGSKSHNIALRDRAIQRGYKLNEYALYRVSDEAVVAGESEEGIYEALGLAWVPPELRENRGEIEAAEERVLPRLVERQDVQGDVHVHTTATDGRADAETMATAARDAGLRYIAITDHSQALAMANGLNEEQVIAHAARVRALNDRPEFEGFTALAGIECDIRSDGTLDLAHDCLAELDYVVASVHSAFNQEERQMTDRLLRAIECPYVDTIGHPTGRLILKREPYRFDGERVFAAAAAAGVAMEINSQVDRLDLDEMQARRARARGVRLIVASDAHSPAALGGLRWGISIARRAWLEADDVLNTRPVDGFKSALRRNR